MSNSAREVFGGVVEKSPPSDPCIFNKDTLLIASVSCVLLFITRIHNADFFLVEFLIQNPISLIGLIKSTNGKALPSV